MLSAATAILEDHSDNGHHNVSKRYPVPSHLCAKISCEVSLAILNDDVWSAEMCWNSVTHWPLKDEIVILNV